MTKARDFADFAGTLTATGAEVNALDGVTATASEINALDGITASTSELNILQGCTATASGLNFASGLTVISQADIEAGTSTTAGVVTPERVSQAIAALAEGGGSPTFLSGMETIPHSGDRSHDIQVDAGSCGASGGQVITLSSSIIKKIDASWASGTNAGGLSSSLTVAASTTYHIFAVLIGGSADVLFDTSLTCANGIADHSVTSYRRIASLRTDASSNIIRYRQYGNRFVYNSAITIFSQNTGVNSTYSLVVPTGISVEPTMTLNGNEFGGITYSARHPEDSSTTNAYVLGYGNNWATMSCEGSHCQTNTSGQVVISSGSHRAYGYLLGYVDTRGI